jgi:hypothetical protein
MGPCIIGMVHGAFRIEAVDEYEIDDGGAARSGGRRRHYVQEFLRNDDATC